MALNERSPDLRSLAVLCTRLHRPCMSCETEAGLAVRLEADGTSNLRNWPSDSREYTDIGESEWMCYRGKNGR